MSCEDCSFPYSLCQCPATITVGELAQLRVSLAEAQKELAALKTGGVGSLLVRKARPAPSQPRHCFVDDCDQEPDSSGLCERHRPDCKALP